MSRSAQSGYNPNFDHAIILLAIILMSVGVFLKYGAYTGLMFLGFSMALFGLIVYLWETTK